MSDTRADIKVNIQNQPTDATLAAVDGGWTLTMSRHFPHPVERVWAMVTEPDLLVQWSPVVPDRPLTSVGAAASRETPTATPVDAEVLEVEAPYLLVHRWGSHTLRWTIEPSQDGCRLTLQHRFADADERGMYAAGWHICLAVLQALMDGAPTERVVGRRATDYGWPALRQAYDAELSV